MTSQINEIYFQQHCFLIRVRYFTQLLARLWKYLHWELPRLGIPNILCRKLQFIRHNAHEFANTYNEYIYHFVVEGSWTILMDKIDRSKTFNNIFKCHVDYLTSIRD